MKSRIRGALANWWNGRVRRPRVNKDYRRIVEEHAKIPLYQRNTNTTTYFGRNIPPMFQGMKELLRKRKGDSLIIHEIGIGEPKYGSVYGSVPSEPYELYNLGKAAGKKHVEVFATDISSYSISKARELEKIKLVDRPTLDLTEDAVKYFKERFFPEEQRIKTMELGSCYGTAEPHTTIKIPEEAKKHIHFERADIITSTPARKSDVTACFAVLEHYYPKEREVILKNISSAMKKGGYLLTDENSLKGRPNLAGLKRVSLIDKGTSGYPILVYKKVK